MADQTRSEIIRGNPIGNVLDSFKASFKSVCEDRGISCTPDALGQLGQKDLQNIALDLLSALQGLRASRLLPARGSGNNLLSDLLRLVSAVNSDDFDFDFDRIKPLLNAALADSPDDALIWDQVYRAVTESTPPPRPIASSLQQTPWIRNTSSFANSSEYRKDIDRVLREELGAMYVDLPRFCKTFFSGVAGLEAASEAVFQKCREGDSPLFNKGWSGWPKDANQDDVLSWFADLNEKLVAFAEEYKPTLLHRRRPLTQSLTQPNKPIQGSTGERKMDIGFVSNPDSNKDSRCHWSQILVPGELKSNPSADIHSKARLDLGRYAREVLAAQDTRRFVLGFTLCGPLMRIWEFDRLGGIASKQFDINKEGLQFVSTILGFLWMNEEQLGFDPTITTPDGQPIQDGQATRKGQCCITIQRDGRTERFIIDRLMKRSPCIAGRATTCWKAHREDNPQIPFVIKDSWQYTEREEEGKLLQEATDGGVINVARYYHHETVYVRGEVDEIQDNVRGGLDITKASNYGQSGSIDGKKRSSSQAHLPLPPSKHPRSASSTKAGTCTLPNRVHRRIVLCDYGKPIYKASSRAALLCVLEGCIEGHESLRKAGVLHRDISVNNLMINEDEDNPSWRSFLIDLDLAVREPRENASGAKGKTGTRAFMAIGALLGEQHSFMHDLESFFWVLFWICIHHDGPDDKGRVIPQFDKWNYVDVTELAKTKIGTISEENVFQETMTEFFTKYYEPLIPWLNRLRKVVFPDGKKWKKADPELYSSMKKILRDAREDPDVLPKS
ncbi:hypothetical protein F5883DRAFT_508959 [Diaporthe sp. PMI_573]|nr:hypothetical protein F5883DRAFT_508959 [Diaporthaceae sp. PMI_573]